MDGVVTREASPCLMRVTTTRTSKPSVHRGNEAEPETEDQGGLESKVRSSCPLVPQLLSVACLKIMTWWRGKYLGVARQGPRKTAVSCRVPIGTITARSACCGPPTRPSLQVEHQAESKVSSSLRRFPPFTYGHECMATSGAVVSCGTGALWHFVQRQIKSPTYVSERQPLPSQ